MQYTIGTISKIVYPEDTTYARRSLRKLQCQGILTSDDRAGDSVTAAHLYNEAGLCRARILFQADMLGFHQSRLRAINELLVGADPAQIRTATFAFDWRDREQAAWGIAERGMILMTFGE